ncbi:MAG TPA: TetR/AcrR family transcriptional regulator C-terminal domain-containing protein, partial [Acidimicrobiales bacterium]|nr:TetR/AcrR family transcriptional regulator C-terminal domain-containing protein [Acidimicrobiales bacterium]
HVADKNHLLDLMLDAVESEEEIGPASGNWHEDLALLARRQHQALLRHPWVVDFVGGRPSLGPHVILRLEQSLALLDDLGLDARTAVDILSTLNTYVLGAVIRELREMRNDHDLESLGHTRPSLELEFRDWQLRLRASGRFARFLRIFDEDVDPDDPATRNERFEFGLRCVLDGIAAAVARRAPRP